MSNRSCQTLCTDYDSTVAHAASRWHAQQRPRVSDSLQQSLCASHLCHASPGGSRRSSGILHEGYALPLHVRILQQRLHVDGGSCRGDGGGHLAAIVCLHSRLHSGCQLLGSCDGAGVGRRQRHDVLCCCGVLCHHINPSPPLSDVIHIRASCCLLFRSLTGAPHG